MKDLEKFDIRFSELEDLKFLEEWFQDASACDDFPFNEKEKGDFLKNWIGFSKFKASLTGMMEEKPCTIGTLFLMPYRKVAHHSSFYIMVDPKMRKKGVGTQMIRNLLHLARTRFRVESVDIEIFEPNPISSILKKLGFQEVFRQENFMKLRDQAKPRVVYENRFS